MGRDISESDSELSTCGKIDDSIIEPSNLKPESKQHACDIDGCKKRFNRPWKLIAHKQLHNNERPYACKEKGCSKAFTNSSHLKRHIRTSHENSILLEPIKCPEPGCEALLKTKQFLSRHLKRKHSEDPFKCTECGTGFKRSRQLKEHAFIHTGIHPFICSICGLGFEKSYDLKRHDRGHRVYACKLDSCTETLHSMSQYRKHIAQCHKPKPACPICDKTFSTSANLRIHMMTHSSSEDWVCSMNGCDQKFSQEKYLKQHWQHVHEQLYQYQCSVDGCNKIFGWKKCYTNHLKLHSTNSALKSRSQRKKERKERKDKGQPKKSIAAELANVRIPEETHKKLLNNNLSDIEEGNMSDISVASEVVYLPLKENSNQLPDHLPSDITKLEVDL